jgi:amino acid adenylation domain-containing protein
VPEPNTSSQGEGRLDAALLASFAAFPDRVAVDDHGDTLNYTELEARALTLAATLRERGVAVGSTVAVHLERSADLVVALVGSVLAGAAHIAVDPGDPLERIEFMLNDSSPRVLVSTPALAERLQAEVPLVTVPTSPGTRLPAAARGEGDPADPCYLVYTSGSTGRPKASSIPHRAIVSRLRFLQRFCALEGDDRVLYNTASSFDVSVAELYWPLLSGATLVVSRSGGQRDADYLADVVREKKITTLHFVPSLLDLFLVARDPNERYDGVRRVMAAGEALAPELVQRWHARSTATLYNLYGPSECAVYTTVWECPRDPDPDVVLIGSAFDDTELHVLDADMRPVPAGTPGELFIGGAGLALGYHGRPELDKERFLRLPVSPNVLYRSGDLVREVEGRQYQYLGRLDRQIKIRGFRVELAEIESVAAAVDGVRRVAVVATPDPVRLVAALEQVDPGGSADALVDAVRRAAVRRLPSHMVPTALFVVDSMPLTPNGKLDDAALLEQARPLLQREAPVSRPPEGPVELAVARIWCDALGMNNVGRDDDLFDIGGSSLTAVRIVKAVRKQFALALPMRVVFAARTVRLLAAAVAEAAAADGRSAADVT